MKTKAAVLFKLNKPLRMEDLEIPNLQKGQVLVKILASGLCRTQINEWKGYKGDDKFLPHLLGHEAAGMVVKTGSGVKKIKPGDYVVASWIKGEGLDVPSARYLRGTKIINSGAIATFSQYAVISENRLTRISDKVPAEVASLLGCAFPTGAGIVKNTLKIKKGDSLAVFGAGGVGASAILSAKSVGCTKIIAVDVNDRKLEFARKLGANQVINVSKENAAEKIRKIADGGVRYAIEASGNKSAVEEAFKSLAGGGVLVIAGNLKSGEKISIDPFEFIKGKKIVGSWGGDTVPDRDIPIYAKDYLSGRIKLEKLIGKVMEFREINKAFELLENNKVSGRIIIRMDHKL